MNIERALQEGNILVLRNYDIHALEQVMPIIEWKYKRMMKLLRFFISRSKEETKFTRSNKDSAANILKHEFIWNDDAVVNFNEKTRKEVTLNLNGKNIVVHKNFRLFCLSEQNDVTFSHSLFNKLIFMQIDIEDETFWKQTIFDHMIN